MPTMNRPHVFRVTAFGAGLPGARDRAADWGSVTAVFRHSCHVLGTDGRVTCIVDRRLGKGPVNVCVDIPEDVAVEDLGIEAGTPLRRSGDDLHLGDGIVLDLSGGELWTPPPIGPRTCTTEVRRRARTLSAALGPSIPGEGLAPMVPLAEHVARGWTAAPGPATPVTALALPRARDLVRGLVSIDARLVETSAAGLIGLGPGLTPSGDDFLAGLMVAMSAYRPEAAGCALRDSVLRLAPDRTTALSATLLAHAADGTGSESMHRLLAALLGTGDQPDPEGLARLMADGGRTSGWDALAGLLLGIHLALRLRDADGGRLLECVGTRAGGGR